MGNPPVSNKTEASDSRRTLLERGLTATKRAIAGTAAAAPDKVLPELLKTLDVLDEKSPLRMAIIQCLERPAKSETNRAIILPALYRAMVDQDVYIRYASIGVFEAIAERRTDDLPGVLFECALALLADPYVLVHRTVIRALLGIAQL